MGRGRIYFGKNNKLFNATINTEPQISAIGNNSVSIVWDSVPNATSYEVFVGSASSGPWTSHGTTSGTDYVVDNLSQETTYFIKVLATIISENGLVTVQTQTQQTRTIQYTNSYPAAYANGMFQDREPAESGLSGIPIITAPGRTLLSNFGNLAPPAKLTGRKIYGVRFMLGNMSTSPISGGKMIVGLTTSWDGFWTPKVSGVTNNTITGNLMNGWQKVTIGGDELLPIPAAEPRDSEMPLKCVWTDWLPISAGWNLSTVGWDFLTRFLVPPRSAAPYALTYGEWGVESLSRNCTLAGRSQARIRSWAAGGIQTWADYHLRAEGDYVTNPAILANITTIAGQCPPSGPTFVDNMYGPVGFTHTPLLAIEYAINPLGV